MNENGFEIISVYTRAQAIEDGVLLDVTSTAKETGIRFPVAVTAGLWNKYIVPSGILRDEGQSIQGRLWDVLWMFRNAASHCTNSLMFFKVLFLMENDVMEEVKLKSICGPGDTWDPVITIMLPEED